MSNRLENWEEGSRISVIELIKELTPQAPFERHIPHMCSLTPEEDCVTKFSD